MKTKMFAVLLVLFAGLAQAEESKIVNGEIMLVPSNLIATGVKVAPEAEKYPQAAGKAFANPGKPVVAEQKYLYTILDMFHYREDTVSTLEVQYDPQKATIGAFVSNKVVLTEINFSPFIIFWILSIVAFFAVTEMKNTVAGLVFADLLVLALIFAAHVVFALPTSFIAPHGHHGALVTLAVSLTFAYSVAVLAAGYVFFEKKVPKTQKITFYVLMLLAGGLMYYTLFI